MIPTILGFLRQPEYLHVLINPLPVYGLSAGLIGLFIAVCLRNRAATIATLVVVLISAAAAWPAYELGEQAYDGVLSMSDEVGRAWLAAHKARAENLVWLFYAVAILSALALIVPIKWPAPSLWFAIAVLLLGGISLGAGGYIAYAGGKIRHGEFRTEPPPESASGEIAAVSPSRGSASKATGRVTIQALKYSPERIEIKKGETVG